MSGPIDRQTVDQLVVQHLPVALRLALRLTGETDAAEDVVQEALCRILGRWHSYRGEAAFSTWMMQIVINVDRDRKRRRRDLRQLSHEPYDAGAAEAADHTIALELNEQIRAAIHELPERQREVALLSLGHGLDVKAVAYILRTTEANVHTCLHLARKRIAETIGVNYTRRK